ncbi:hypothetical protein EDB86DRAFT_3247764 [Lactarius hatsudake]|nr:hypothetical protein EDB86DRAFT_3247764 [Lactarius hatsudake]
MVGENQPGPSDVCPEGDARGTHEQLEACKYQVALAPDGLMSWELISNSKLEASSSHPQIELIAKHLREGSNELHILDLRTSSRWPKQFLDHRGWLILPKLHLVWDDFFRLQTIDVGVATEVQDENTEVDEYRDTKGWAVPEMGKEDGPTPIPIKNDRWSCGRVLLCHVLAGKGDNRLSEFDCGKEPQPRQDMVEESLKLPDAKKPRLADD